jgi:hypothetical protein
VLNANHTLRLRGAGVRRIHFLEHFMRSFFKQ